MKNTTKKLSTEKLRKILFENYTISELDVVDSDSNAPESTTTIDSSVSPTPTHPKSPINQIAQQDAMIGNDSVGIDQRYAKLSEKNKQIANYEIERVLRTGRMTMNTDMAKHKHNYDVFNYVTSKLADMYHDYHLPYDLAINKLKESGNEKYVRFYEMFVGQKMKLKEIAESLGMESAAEVRDELKVPVFRLLEGQEQTKIKNALMAVFMPMLDGQPTVVFNMLRTSIGGYSGAGNSYQNDAGTTLKDITETIMSSYYPGFERALQYYDANKGTFYNYVLRAVKDTMVTLLKQVRDGHRVATNSFSMDTPLDTSDNGSVTFADSVIDSNDDDQTNNNRFTRAADAQMDAITNKLDKGKQQSEREILYHAVVGYITNLLKSGRSSIAYDIFELLFIKQVTPEEAAEKLGISRAFVDKKVNDIKKLINLKMDDFKAHLGQEMGKDVEFPDNKFNVKVADLREVMSIIAPMVLEVISQKFNSIDKTYSSINKISGLIKESYNLTTEDNSMIGTQDLYNRVQEFVSITVDSLNKLGVELHEIFRISQEIHNDYPGISKTIESTVNPMIDTLFSYPKQLERMLTTVRHLYNPNNARLN